MKAHFDLGGYVWSRRAVVGSVCWLIRRKNQGSSPRPDIKTKYLKYFFGDFLSQQISAKNSENEYENCHEKFL